MTSDPKSPDDADEPNDDYQEARLVVRTDPTRRRLDQYLDARLPRLSRTAVQKLIEAGQVRVNGRPSKASHRLTAGDAIDVVFPPPQPRRIPPEPIPIDVVWEDEHLLAVNKQAGLVVHPARGNPHGTLVNGLAHYAEQSGGRLSRGTDPFRPGIVHRLDRDTTGIMLVAKTDEAHWRLNRQFADRRVHKVYLAVVHGRVELDADRIDAPLARHRRVRERYAVARNDPDAKQALTTYRVRERFNGYTLVQLEPKTGRTHQLRVHMSHIRHPLVGDRDYGGRAVTRAELTARPGGANALERRDDAPIEAPLITRQALHAAAIRFEHPVTGQPMELSAPPPEDFARLLEALRTLCVV